MLLIIEDDDDTRAAYHEFLEMMGFEVQSAGTGAEALAIARVSTVDAVLLDLTLPDVDGRDLSAQLRETVAPDVPMLAMTGHSLAPHDQARFTAVMRKPVDLDAVAEWVRRQPRRAGTR